MNLIDRLRAWWDADMQTEEAYRLILALRGRLESQWRATHAES